MARGLLRLRCSSSGIAEGSEGRLPLAGLSYGEATRTNPGHFLLSVGCLRGVVPERTSVS